MVINSIKITNFRCYYGTSSLTFNSDGKITIIYGDSGCGKSSLLQFFRWMFYNEYDFGKNDDKPLFNITAYNECKLGEMVEVSGQIDFTHLGVSYRLNKSEYYIVSLKIENASLKESDYRLQIKGNDESFHPFNGDVLKKINTILPRELSKYFLLDGERSRDIVLNSEQLKLAIHSLFGLDVYSEAISHIGTNKNAKTSVLGYYSSKMVSNSSSGSTSLGELYDRLQDMYEDIEINSNKLNDISAKIKQKNLERDEALKTLGELASQSHLNELVKEKQKRLKENALEIIKLQHNFGDIFYKNYPYLMLGQITSETSTILRNRNNEYLYNYKDVFVGLKKDLLEEIKQKNKCICGRELDDKSINYINHILKMLPPNPPDYLYKQFVHQAKQHIRHAQQETMQYESIKSAIAEFESKNNELEEEINSKMEILHRLDDYKDKIDQLENLSYEISRLENEKNIIEKNKAKCQYQYDILNHRYTEDLKKFKISSQYKESLSFFEKIVDLIKEEKERKEEEVRITLNNCVREIFKKLTTQTELDVDKIKFINNDFSLRTTYLTGGQLAVDVYSYVIGIIKALQEFKMENNENPIIIDAPFAFTGNTQSEHVFKTLPTVSKQTILLTLDLNKIKKLLFENNLYDFYIIKNDTQEKATIARGDINDIKF